MARLSVHDRQELLQSFKSSGLAQQAWCRTHGVNVHSLRYWLGQERKGCLTTAEPKEPQWLTFNVQTAIPAAASPQSLLVQTGQYVVTVPVGFNAEHLGRVIRALAVL